MRRSALLASLVVGWAWVPPSHHHRTPHAVRKPLKAENDYLASLAKAPPKRGPGRLRRAWRRLRGAPAALSSDEVLRLVVLGHGRAEAEAMAPRRARRLLARAAAAAPAKAAPAPAAPAPAKPPAAPAPAAPPAAPPPPPVAAPLEAASPPPAAPPLPATPPPAAAPLEAPPPESEADALTPDEILRLVVLGRSRADALAMDPVEARRELAAVAAAPPPEPRLDVADATDEELWRLARAEVAIPRPPRDDEEDAIDRQLDRSWPDLDKFTDLLTKESLKRLEVLGPQFAEPLKTEARWRRKAYESWLRLVDGKGVLPGPAGDLAYGEALFDPNGGLPAEASDEAKAAFVRLREERAELRAARNELRDWEKRALPDK